MYRLFIKRSFDIIVAGIILLGFWWLFIIVALLVRINLGSPVIFKQKRPGRDGRLFTLYKFKSMNDAKDASGNLLHAEKRLTPFGVLLRSTSLDELPQTINILKGEMSFIGPRPLLVRYLPRYSNEQFRRHEIRPGITGWAQVNGRNSLGWDDKFRMDNEYVDNYSFLMDLNIFFLTIGKVFSRKGISPSDRKIIREFMVEPQGKQEFVPE